MNRFLSVIERYKLQIGLLCASCCGAIIAIGSHPALQDPVECGQVIAGIVSYPSDNPSYAYHVKLWTLLNQIAAVLLYTGMSEINASLILEGLTGAVSFSALFLIVYSICERAVIALFTPLFMYFFNFVGIDIVYPIRLLGTAHTYGIFGLSYAILVVGFIGVGWHRTGAFLAGLAPAFHPSLGVFCVLITACSVFLNRKAIRPKLALMALYFCAGALITVASIVWQQQLAATITGTDPSMKLTYLEAFILNFDYHRSFSGWGHSGFFLGLVVSCIVLVSKRKYLMPLGAKFVLAAVVSSVAVTFVIALLSEFVTLFGFLKVLMPWRYMNFVNLCLMPIVLGALANANARLPIMRAIFLFLMLGVCALWLHFSLPFSDFLYFGICLSFFLMTAASRSDILVRPLGDLLRWQNTIIATATGVLFMVTVLPAARSLATRPDGDIPQLYQFVSMRPGMLLTAGEMSLIQLQTRRPVLIDTGSLDFFPYVPDTGPRFNDILKDVYGTDIFVTPSQEDRNKGVITRSHQLLWELRTPEEWHRIREKFGVTDIFVPAPWELQLPLIADDGGLRLFTIP